MNKRCMLDDAQNQYAKKFGESQFKIEQFYEYLIFSKTESIKLWNEMKFSDPDVAKILRNISRIYKNHIGLERCYK